MRFRGRCKLCSELAAISCSILMLPIGPVLGLGVKRLAAVYCCLPPPSTCVLGSLRVGVQLSRPGVQNACRPISTTAQHQHQPHLPAVLPGVLLGDLVPPEGATALGFCCRLRIIWKSEITCACGNVKQQAPRGHMPELHMLQVASNSGACKTAQISELQMGSAWGGEGLKIKHMCT